jgi:NDP-sugar pyrophosphorylase family protein
MITSAMQVIVLCGGLGTRFREVQSSLPKALAPVKGQAFIDVIVEFFRKQGFSRFVLATGYLSEQICHHFGSQENIEIIISKESSRLGTGGAIRNALGVIDSDPVVVVNGDSYVDLEITELIEMHCSKGADATIVVSSQITGSGFGQVLLANDGGVTEFREKPSSDIQLSFKSAGIYCMSRDFIAQIPSGRRVSLENEVLPNRLKTSRIYGYEIGEPVYDIGTRDGYEMFLDLGRK